VPINSLSLPILSCLCSQRTGKTKSSLHTIFLLGNFRIKMACQNVDNPREVFPEMPVSKCQHHPAACPQGLQKKVVLLPVCVFSLSDFSQWERIECTVGTKVKDVIVSAVIIDSAVALETAIIIYPVISCNRGWHANLFRGVMRILFYCLRYDSV
jgi:hypothetical protein